MIEIPAWAQLTPERRAHVERVAVLLDAWAAAVGVTAKERDRWRRAAALHDALKDAPGELLRELAPDAWGIEALRHGPAAARMAREHGERDQGVLDAVRYHSVGYAGWDDVGRMLYLADYLEPNRDFDLPDRAALVAAVPGDSHRVLCAVTALRHDYLRARGRDPLPISLEFEDSLKCGD